MKMTSEEFHAWSQRLQFASETEALIAAIRSSPPVRRVSGRANNITGRYPSPKMGMSIHCESDRAKSGRRTTQWHTPDFFVLRCESAGWEEWKQERALDPLAESQPTRYQNGPTG